MDLSTLPLLVLQTLIECLDPQSLVSISYTCHKLNIEANRRLYRSPYIRFNEHKLRKLLYVLRPPHSALSFLREYYVHDMESLCDLWSKSSLNLHCLKFLPSCFNPGNITTSSLQCFDSMLPGTSVTEVKVYWPVYVDYDERAVNLLGVLYRLDSLVNLRILDLSRLRFVDKLITAINCPQLKRLYISACDIIPCLRDKLPSLEVVWINGWGNGEAWTQSDPAHYYTPPEKWKRLEYIMERRISFIYTHTSAEVIQTLPFVFSYANRYGPVDSTRMATWLLQSQHLLNNTHLFDRPKTPSSLDLSVFSIRSRDKTIPLLQEFDYESLRLRLYSNDTHIANALPQTLVSLYLVTSERGSLYVVPDILLTLSELKRVTIQLIVGTVDQDGWNGFEELLPPLDEEMGPYPTYIHYKLELHRDSGLFWEMARSVLFHEMPVFKRTDKVHVPELEGAVTDWLSLNPSVDTIRLVFSPQGETEDDYIDEELP
jgi:hypothetical protein